jgi:predicted enzyme related to lactoylglutathione lyase
MTDSNVGRFVWYDLLTERPEAAIAFYGHVVGWTSQPFEQGYTLFVGNQGPLGGTVQLPDAMKRMGAPPHWTSNVQVASADATVAKVRELGGSVYAEPKDYPKVGRLAVIADPQGATINVFQPTDPMKLHDSTKPGEFTWSELLSSNHEAAFRFYSALFGWKKQRDHDMARSSPTRKAPRLRCTSRRKRRSRVYSVAASHLLRLPLALGCQD